VVFLNLVASGQRGSDTFFSNLAPTLSIILARVSCEAALAKGFIGIAKEQGAVCLHFSDNCDKTLGSNLLTW